MKDDKYIESLFDLAKKEPPKLSYQEVAERFSSSATPASAMESIKEFFSTLNLNSMIMISISSLIITAFVIFSSPLAIEEGNMPVSEKQIPEIEASKQTFQSSDSHWSPDNQTIKKEAERQPEQDFLVKKTNNSVEEETYFPETEIRSLNDLIEIQSIDLPPLLSFDFTKDTIPPLALTSATNSFSGNDEFHSIYPDKSTYSFLSDINCGSCKDWESYTKTFQKEMDLTVGGWTEIISEWGKVEVKTWNQNKVKFDVLVTLGTDEPKKAAQVLENIEVVFMNNEKGVSAETLVQKKKAIKWNKRKNWDISIDYVVYVPTNSNLKIHQFNGNVTLETLNGAAHLDLAFTDLDAGEIGDNSKIIMRNGKGNISKSGDLETKLYFSTVKVGEVGNLIFENHHTSFDTQKAKNVKGKSYYGTYSFGDVQDFENVGQGDKIELGRVGKMNLNLQNATINFEEGKDLEAEFVHSKLSANKLGDVKMNFQHGLFEVETVGNIVSTSHWGTMKLGAIGNFENNTHGTKVNIKTAKAVKVKGNNSKMIIGQVAEKLDLDLTYGGCDAAITNSNPEIFLTGKNASFNLSLPKKAQFLIDIDSNIKNYLLPAEIQTGHLIEKIGTYEIEGFLGNENANNQIKAALNYGKLELKME